MDYLNTLRYWHRLEHFYPYNVQYSKSENIIRYSIADDSSFPDFSIKENGDSKIAFYDVYFGLFKVSNAMEIIERELGKQPFIEKDQNESCFCKFSLTTDGKFSKDSFRISAYPWAVNRIYNHKVNLDQWDDKFKSYTKAVFMMFNDINTEFTYEICLRLKNLLSRSLNWDIDFSNPWMVIEAHLVKSDSICDYEKEELEIDKILQNNELLNSFYIKDLERVIESYKNGTLSKGLNQFIYHTCEERIDIEKNYNEIKRIMNPDFLPLGNWPSDYGLRFMQQLDINLFMSQNDQNIFSINGPPGTGKTTLLKSIVAAIVVKRAEKLSELAKPDEAFDEKNIGCIKYKEIQNWIYKLKDDYSHYGILITSNNNGAVENISKELPARHNIPEKYRGVYTYLNKISDNTSETGDTWGLLAATLGKKKNRNDFINKFWPLHDKNMYSLQKEIHKECDIEDWEMKIIQFKNDLSSVKSEVDLLKNIYNASLEYWNFSNHLESKINELSLLNQKVTLALDNMNEKNNEYLCYKGEKEENSKRIKEFEEYDFLIKIKAKFLFIFPKAKEYANICSRNLKLLSIIIELESSIKEQQKAIDSIKKQIDNVNSKILSIKNQMYKLKEQVDNFKIRKKQDFSFIDFFDPNLHDIVSKKSPYGYKELNEKREKLFFSALSLHESFVMNSNKMRSNLDAFSKWMRDICTYEDKRKFSKVLLDSFFMVVPVVSSTFASVSSFLRDIGKGEIPYVLIDEAGQGIPPSAAGVLWRADRSIVVGDPLQIEPIFTIHERIINALKDYYNQDDIITDHLVSVQTLADLANPYVGYRTVGNMKQIVGAPLIVHSRCKKTVFDIANEIAYDNKMIFDTFKGYEEDVFRWIDVKGTCDEGHFIKDQVAVVWEYIKNDLSKQDNEIAEVPSIYIISPFKSVKEGMLIYFWKKLNEQTNTNEIPDNLKKWLNGNIGTIHTFQGKEADKVFLCLGVDSSKKNGGSVAWASQSPNILNVAITRAKKELYIIGDKELWGNLPYYNVALKYVD